MRYYQASAHRFGSGKVHMVPDALEGDEHPYASYGDSYDGTRTMCGKALDQTPGKPVTDEAWRLGEHCLGCQKVAANREQAAERHRTYQVEQVKREQLREEADRRWWEVYTEYLDTAIWDDKREKVLAREDYVCQGCGWRNRRASHVHHLKYPRNCLPGSQEWIKQEKLFDLVALCNECHHDVHPDKDW